MESQDREQVRTPKEQMENIDAILTSYEESIGVKIKEPTDAEKYLNMTAQEMRAMTLDECAEASIILSQLSAFIQREQNREACRVKLAEQKLMRAHLNDDSFGGSWDSRKFKAIQNDEALKKWNDIKNYAELRELRLRNISLNIKNIADQFKNLQYAKVKSNG